MLWKQSTNRIFLLENDGNYMRAHCSCCADVKVNLDMSRLIQQARTKLGMSQKDFATVRAWVFLPTFISATTAENQREADSGNGLWVRKGNSKSPDISKDGTNIRWVIRIVHIYVEVLSLSCDCRNVSDWRACRPTKDHGERDEKKSCLMTTSGNCLLIKFFISYATQHSTAVVDPVKLILFC